MTRKRTWYVFAAMMVAVLSLVALMYVPRFGSGVVREAATSRIGVIVTVVLVGGCVLLALLGLVIKRCTDRPHPPLWQFFKDDGGTAAVEMLLALPIIAMIFLVMLQATVMWNANVIFHYASYATARAAVSIIPSKLDISGEDRHLMYNDSAGLMPKSYKFARIRRTAVLSLVPISGKLPASVDRLDPEISGEDVQRFVQQGLTRGQADASLEWHNRIGDQFRYADYFVTLAIKPPEHWHLSNPGEGCPWRNYRRGDWQVWDYQAIPFCPFIEGTYDFPPWETLELHLWYPYEMSVPWAGRVLAQLGAGESFLLPGTSQTSYYTWLESTTKM